MTLTLFLTLQIEWGKDFDAGVSAAKATGKPLVVHFVGKGSALCEKMAAETFLDADVVRASAGLVHVKLNFGTDGRALFTSLGLSGVPQTVFFDGEGHPYWAAAGFLEAQDYLKELKKAASAGPKMAAYRDAMRRDPADDANLAGFAAFVRECGLPGAALGLQERRIEALESRTRSEAESRTLAGLYLYVGSTFLDRREPSRTLTYLASLEKLDRSNGFALADNAAMLRARALAECRRLDEAIAALQAGLDKYSPFDEVDAALYYLGSWKVARQDAGGARAAFEALIDDHPASRYRKSAEAILKTLN